MSCVSGIVASIDAVVEPRGLLQWEDWGDSLQCVTRWLIPFCAVVKAAAGVALTELVAEAAAGVTAR